MLEWKKMTNKFIDELKKFQMVCFYCAESMNENSVNRQCEHNSERTPDKNCKFFSSDYRLKISQGVHT